MRKLFFAAFFVFAIFAAAGSAQTTLFTFQGRLTDNSAAANGTYQMQFSLWDAVSGGTQIGTTVANNTVTVNNGVFTVQLDFSPATPFAAGANRWIEVAVRKAADPPGYTTLSPRQQITSAPYATRAKDAASADSVSTACSLCITDAHISSVDANKVTGTVASAATAGNALSLGGVPASGYLQTSGGTITGNLTVNGTLNANLPGGFKWNEVTGTSQQALPNNGYMATNGARVTITLPKSPNPGDTIRVSGAGEGGWKVAQNPGQRVVGYGVSFLNWTSYGFQYVAASSDGNKLAAVNYHGIWTSTDSGLSWTQRDAVQGRNWFGIASSADGTKLVAIVSAGQIYTSADSGLTWTPREANRNWAGVASSADGVKLVATDSGGQIYTSTDSGVTWTPHDSNRYWYSVASSADGVKLVAIEVNNGRIYTSTDSGATWVARDSNRYWFNVASSSDGTKLVAVVNGGQIYTSTDSGITWIPRDSVRNWVGLASSTDGTKLVASEGNGPIYTSTDSGVSWTLRNSRVGGNCIASSFDGMKLFSLTGPLFISNDAGATWTNLRSGTLPGAEGYVTGDQLASIELQYIGNGQFMTLSFGGTPEGH